MAQLSVLTPDLANRRYPDVEILVTKDWVRKFFESIGRFRPTEDEVPLSFYNCMRAGEFHIFADLGIDLMQLLHVSQSFTYHAQLRIGDEIKTNSKIVKLTPRKLGGELVVYLELGTTYMRGDELVAEADGSVIVRELR